MSLLLLAPHARDLGGGFRVRRLLPSMQRQAVGPFVFFDHMGPITAGPADNHDVRPHPHIGLATVTYLFEGAMLHRDSIGRVQRIEPGAINLMVAGRGVAHSERTPDDLRHVTRTNHGLQLWIALPDHAQEVEPEFFHVASGELPQTAMGEATVRVLMGEAFGLRSPVPAVSPALYLDITLPAGASLVLPAAAPERAVYSVDHGIHIDDQPVPACTLAVLEPGSEPRIAAPKGARVVVVGGHSVGPRFIWWNFVSDRRERIVRAADDWAAGRFAAVPGETEFIPLPEKRLTA
jgi:redox-sensitive bicupin YhaK (pirin superfamily)